MDRKILMHVGPTMIDIDVLLAGVRNNTGFASPEFVTSMGNALNGLKYVMNAPDYQPFILPGSGTMAMESVTSLLKKGDNVLIVSSGVFGDRWVNIFKKYPLNIKHLRSEPGHIIPQEEVSRELENGKYKMVTITQVETSTGVLYPVESLVKKIRDKVDIIVVDAVASAGAEKLNVQDWGIDVCLTASQKAMAAPPGAALMVLSQNAVNHLSENSISGFYTDLNQWIKVMNSFQNGKSGYYTTLPVHIVFSLEKAFDLIREETLENRIKRHEIVSGAIRAGLNGMDMPVMAEKGFESHTVTGMMLDGISMNDFLSECLNNGIEMATGIVPEYAGKYVRIGHMGWINQNDAISTVAVIERVLRDMGRKIPANSGVSAAQEYLSSNIKD
ncbi:MULTISPECIES: alanine--glyoxylate aminotransferase family protein [Acidiplasma]|uniref:Septum site-determining protein n=2 Tax=Acidiplasma TaxID=507753 RepID=A0A0Q0XLR7_9ARCH|nr:MULTISPECIES: alanine--glyoxylate aminotransferase family protein [Acidiplasma]KJE49251.1 septum site-determining protein [Acidiplasma sp. MBA-1]KPV44208.1 septum site-determining protein [Acidiplasma aeolicum]KQB36369.1 septum site-determining protein [Acidiplasma cupricumulans]WMT54780.1 MAG: alanine--glyoxylate aminotransferase family protein [Acidiplasma sp.]